MVKEESAKMQKKFRWGWLALLLLPIALFLPLVGEGFQKAYIGDEEYCCASFLIPEVVEKVERAKSLHWLSNIIIGGSIFLSIVTLIVAVIILYRYTMPQITKKALRNVAKTTVAVAIVPVVLLTMCITAYFLFDNHGYYVHRAQAPDNGIYGDFFYKELFYLAERN